MTREHSLHWRASMRFIQRRDTRAIHQIGLPRCIAGKTLAALRREINTCADYKGCDLPGDPHSSSGIVAAASACFCQLSPRLGKDCDMKARIFSFGEGLRTSVEFVPLYDRELSSSARAREKGRGPRLAGPWKSSIGLSPSMPSFLDPYAKLSHTRRRSFRSSGSGRSEGLRMRCFSYVGCTIYCEMERPPRNSWFRVMTRSRPLPSETYMLLILRSPYIVAALGCQTNAHSIRA